MARLRARERGHDAAAVVRWLVEEAALRISARLAAVD
jgi:hypothetical protein